MKNIIFIAPPSAGKGTQSEMLVQDYGYRHISTGDILREVAKEDSEFGRDINRRLQAGELISDEIINKLLKDVLLELGENKFILDGYPRTRTQAETLNEVFKELNIKDYMVIYLDIDKQMALERALGRVTCGECAAIYNLYNVPMKPKVDGICDKCGASLIQRNDDNEEAFGIRFETYLKNVEPILDYYRNLGKLEYVKVQEEKIDTYKLIEEILKGE